MFTRSRRSLLAAAALALAASALPAAAQNYPSRPITLIVPWGAGGGTDATARILGSLMEKDLGQPVNVVNRTGGSGVVGHAAIASAPPDGYTIGLATTGTHAINPTLYKKLPHDSVKDFTHLTLAVRYANVLVVNPKVPVNNVNELIAYAKANPGKVTFGSAGNGSSNHLSGEVLKYLTGAPMTHVPYKGSGPAMTDVLAGNLTFMFDVLVTSLPQIAAGRVRPLAVTSDQRSPHAPDIPSIVEAGVKGFNEAGSDLWFGVVGPAGIPKPIVSILNAKLIEALNSPDLRARIKVQAFDVATSTPEEFTRIVEKDRQSWAKIVKASGAQVD